MKPLISEGMVRHIPSRSTSQLSVTSLFTFRLNFPRSLRSSWYLAVLGGSLNKLLYWEVSVRTPGSSSTIFMRITGNCKQYKSTKNKNRQKGPFLSTYERNMPGLPVLRLRCSVIWSNRFGRLGYFPSARNTFSKSLGSIKCTVGRPNNSSL